MKVKKKKREPPINIIRYYEEWYGQLIGMIIKLSEKGSVIKSDEICDERVRPYYEKGLSYVDCFNELFKNKL